MNHKELVDQVSSSFLDKVERWIVGGHSWRLEII